MSRQSRIYFEIDGPGVSPASIDPIAILEQSAEWFKTLRAVAASMQASLTLEGLEVVDKCVAIATTPSDLAVARAADRKAGRLVAGSERVPPELERRIEEVRRSLARLPVGLVARTIVGTRRAKAQTLTVPAATRDASCSLVTTLRAQLRTLHGGPTPSASFVSPAEARPFTVQATREQVLELGRLLYQPLDVTVRLRRDRTGGVEPRLSVLLDVAGLDDSPPTRAWREWLVRSAPEWSEVDDVEAELDREVG